MKAILGSLKQQYEHENLQDICWDGPVRMLANTTMSQQRHPESGERRVYRTSHIALAQVYCG